MFEIFTANPIFTIALVLIIGILVSIIVLFFRLRPSSEVLYVDEDSATGYAFNVISSTPKRLYCEDNYRFLRFSKGYNFKRGLKLTTRWWAKRGTAYTKMLKNGSITNVNLLDIFETILSPTTLKKIPQDEYEQIKNSDIAITVELETGFTPIGSTAISEYEAKKEANEEFASMLGKKARQAQMAQDIVKTLALLGAGMAIIFILNALNIIKI